MLSSFEFDVPEFKRLTYALTILTLYWRYASCVRRIPRCPDVRIPTASSDA